MSKDYDIRIRLNGKQLKTLVQNYKRLLPLSDGVHEMLVRKHLLNKDGSYITKLNNIIINFRNVLSQREINFLYRVITEKLPLTDNFRKRLIYCKDNSSLELKIIINNLLNK